MIWIEAACRDGEAEVALLDEFACFQTRASEPRRDVDHEAEVRLNETPEGLLVASCLPGHCEAALSVCVDWVVSHRCSCY